MTMVAWDRPDELMDRRSGNGRGHPLDRGVGLGLQADGNERHRQADVEALRDAVGQHERRDVGLHLQEELRRDEVPFEEEVRVALVAVRVFVREDEADIAIAQRQVPDLVEGEVAEVHAEVEAAFSDRLGTLGVDRTEAVDAAGEDPERRIEAVREASRRRRQREARELARQLRVEALQGLELRGLGFDEVADGLEGSVCG